MFQQNVCKTYDVGEFDSNPPSKDFSSYAFQALGIRYWDIRRHNRSYVLISPFASATNACQIKVSVSSSEG